MSSSGHSGAAGKICPYCRTTIEANAPAVVCPQCGIPHHEDCWRENGRCTTFGCQGRATSATFPTPGADLRYVNDRPCPVCGFLMRPYETSCPYCRTNLLDPRMRSGQPRQGAQGLRPHRASVVLAYGVLGALSCCAPLGIAAWAMGNQDLSAMDAGLMDDTGRASTEVGRLLGITSTFIAAGGLMLLLLLFFAGWRF